MCAFNRLFWFPRRHRIQQIETKRPSIQTLQRWPTLTYAFDIPLTTLLLHSDDV
jgi:hypothetical protein